MKTEVESRASKSAPCVVCGSGTKGCSTTTDGAFWCRGEDRERTGFTLVSRGTEFRTYRRENEDRAMRSKPNATPRPATDWPAEARRFAALMTDQDRDALARNLGLPRDALDGLTDLGFSPDDTIGPCWTFPERDDAERVIGINRRFVKPMSGENGGKRQMAVKGSTRGLYLGKEWATRPGPLLLVEGGSDVLALAHCGLAAVGRPSNTGGVDLLAKLLDGARRDVIVVGENDEKADGSWPGKTGAIETATKLSKALGLAVRWSMPPEGIKDARAWVQELLCGMGEVEDWQGMGREVLDHLTATAKTVAPREEQPPQTDNCGEMLVESLAAVRPKPVNYLIPDRIPAGMLGLIAGEGGHGKSVTTLHLAAAITSGRCAFGLDYPNPVSGKVLLVSCEDDWERTVVPRLAAFGADLGRTLRIRGVKLKTDKQTLDFHLGHFRELDRLLNADREIRLVVVDPAGAYIGRAGVNENKDAELRTILGPLSETANRTASTTLLVKHLNKSANVSAVQRVSGSTGYVNAVRFAYMVTPDPEDSARKLLLPIKANVLKSATAGLAYRIAPMPLDEARRVLLDRWPDLDRADAAKLAEQLLTQQWEGETSTTADAVLGTRKRAAGPSVLHCEEFIRCYLGDLAHPDAEVEAAAESQGFGSEVFKNTKTKMRGDESERRLSSRPLTSGGKWWLWIGPQNRPAERRPEPQSGVRAAA